jgi:hypothetical protein
MRTRPRWTEPDVYFRIVHLAQNTQSGAHLAPFSEQAVEIALGPKGAFENGNIGTLTRRAPPDQPIATITDCHDQIREFHKLRGRQFGQSRSSRLL